MKLTRKTLGVGAAVGLLALSMTGTAAQADTNIGSDTTFVAVGSDTTQDVVEGLSNVVKDAAGNPLISNYKSIPVGRAITTRTANANCTFTAPNSSGTGRNALSAAMRNANFTGQAATATMGGCVDIARSSAFGNPATSPGVGTMTFVPFAIDSVTFATLQTSAIPHTLNLADLKALYTATGDPNVAGQCSGRRPLIPAAGSGTRAFFAQVLGITDAAIGTAGSWGTCVRDVNAAGTPIQEHDGRFLTLPTQLVPFSVAQYVAQQSGVISDIRGRASLGSIDFDGAGGANAINPVSLQTSFGNGTRDVFNVVPTSAIDSAFTPPAGSSQIAIPFNQTLRDTVVGSTSRICAASVTIQQFGFALNPNCGATTTRNTN